MSKKFFFYSFFYFFLGGDFLSEPIMTAREFQDKLLIEKGAYQGALEVARKFIPEYGIDTVVRISRFTREELLDE